MRERRQNLVLEVSIWENMGTWINVAELQEQVICTPETNGSLGMMNASNLA